MCSIKNIQNIAISATVYAFTGGLGGSTAFTTLPFRLGSCAHTPQAPFRYENEGSSSHGHIISTAYLQLVFGIWRMLKVAPLPVRNPPTFPPSSTNTETREAVHLAPRHPRGLGLKLGEVMYICSKYRWGWEENGGWMGFAMSSVNSTPGNGNAIFGIWANVGLQNSPHRNSSPFLIFLPPDV